MDAVSGFLTKYGAVPAGEAGPAWGRATAQSLATHLGRLAEARQANRHRPAGDPAIAGLVADLEAVAREVWRRVGAVLVAAPGDEGRQEELCHLLMALAGAATRDVLAVGAK